MKKICITLFVLCFGSAVYAQSVTPDSWRVHYSPNLRKAQVRGGNVSLNASLREEMKLFDKVNANNIYAYLSGSITDVPYGAGKLSMYLNMRGATDTAGTNYSPVYDIFFDGLDTSRGDNSWDLRLYNGYISLDGVIPYTTAQAGRIYVDYLSDFQIDGASFRTGTNSFGVFAYLGKPVSFYLEDYESETVGGGFDFKPIPALKIRGEITRFFDKLEDKELLDDPDYEYGDTLLWKLRGDYALGMNPVTASLYASAGMLHKAFLYEAGGLGKVAGTEVSLWVKGQLERNDEYIASLPVSDFDLVEGTESRYLHFGVNLSQGITDFLAVGAGFETRDNTDSYYGDRGYTRVTGNIDLIRLFEGSYISITGEWYNVPAEGDYKENNRFFVGGRISQAVSDGIELWLGATLTDYKYYYRQYGQVLPNAGENKKLSNSVYVAYAGVGVRPLERLLVQLDYTYEASEVIKAFDQDRDKLSTVSALLSYGF